ncbi:PucR family transcriptional regulator [Frondihabitans sp. PhB188]|uniref:PucR family transcriptional regulator n=1 Tax=Frondihabitans sp. PhB188 TaxID=2485200 RepID=UPI00131545F7|nr:PucR family transcriptional regulator [Frondihabitans sp. PhB188]
MQTTTPPTVRGLLAESALRLIPRLTGDGRDTEIDWVHSSDLVDPTPFLTGDTMLLTTGTQFPLDDADEFYADYVDRLVAAGAVALGFGLEVIREGTPQPLVDACAARGVTLVEVPYEVPFIALIRWVADRIAAREHERDAWTLGAQRAVSVAALTAGTLVAVVRALAEQVEGAVVILSSTGDVVIEENARGTGLDALVAEGRRILGRGSRASVETTLPGWPGFATTQTLGPRGGLRGAIGVAGAGRNDVAMQAVVTSAVAIVEVLLRYGDAERHLEQRLGAVIVRLLLDGHLPGAVAAAAEFDAEIPDALRVGVVVLARSSQPSERWRLVDALTRRHLAFADAMAERIVFLLPAASTDDLSRLVDTTPALAVLPIGLSSVLAPVEAATGLAQATRALGQDPGAGLHVFGDSAAGLLDDLWSPAAESLARRRLGALDGEPGDLVACSRLWLDHNGHWESAAREAGLHRHTLKARIARVGILLDLDLESFAGRAELWALLQASRA